MRRSIYILITLLLYNLHVAAQKGNCPKLPQNYNWHTAEDYQKDQDLVLKTLRWLNRTPHSVDVQQRAIANAFVLEWLSGSPQVTLNVCTDVIKFNESSSELLFSFIHGMAYYKLTNLKDASLVTAYEAGITSAIALAKRSKKMSALPSVRYFDKMIRKKKLNDYLKEKLASGCK